MGNDAKENPSDGFYWIKVDALVVELLARKTLPPKIMYCILIFPSMYRRKSFLKRIKYFLLFEKDHPTRRLVKPILSLKSRVFQIRPMQ